MPASSPSPLVRRAAVGLAVLGCAAVPIAAQPVRCDSLLAAPVRDSVTHTVSLTASAVDAEQGIPASLLALVGQGVAQAFVPPKPLAMWVYQLVPTPASMEPRGYPVVNGDYVAVLHRDGRLTGAAILASSLDAAFDRAVLDAVARVDSIGFRFPPPEGTTGDSAFVRLRVDPYGVRDGGSAPMFRVRVPQRTFTEALVLGEGPPPTVPYSPEALAAGVRGVVTTWFVVDGAGAPIPRSVQVIRADHPMLLRLVLDALPAMRYRPTRLAGCGVPVHLVQRFDLAPPDAAAGAVAGGHARTAPRRLDATRPDITLPPLQQRDSGRRERVLSVSVWIDAAGRPELQTLRIGGSASGVNRGEIERWIAAGQYAPARDAQGNAVRGEYRWDVGATVRVTRVP